MLICCRLWTRDFSRHSCSSARSTRPRHRHAEEVRYFDCPDGSATHDVAPAPDGSVWYTAQRQGALRAARQLSPEKPTDSLGKGAAPTE